MQDPIQNSHDVKARLETLSLALALAPATAGLRRWKQGVPAVPA